MTSTTHIPAPTTRSASAPPFDLPIHDRNQGNIAHSEVRCGRPPRPKLAARFAAITDVVNAYAAFETNQKSRRTLSVRVSRSGAAVARDQPATCTSAAPAALLDLLDAERTYRDTQLGYRQALAAYMTSLQQLNFAVGKQVIP